MHLRPCLPSGRKRTKKIQRVPKGVDWAKINKLKTGDERKYPEEFYGLNLKVNTVPYPLNHPDHPIHRK